MEASNDSNSNAKSQRVYSDNTGIEIGSPIVHQRPRPVTQEKPKFVVNYTDLLIKPRRGF